MSQTGLGTETPELSHPRLLHLTRAMKRMAAAARAAAASALGPASAIPLLSPRDLASAKKSLQEGFADAFCAGVDLPLVLASAQAAHAAYAGSRMEARALAMIHNATEAAEGGPTLLLPLLDDLLALFVDNLHGERRATAVQAAGLIRGVGFPLPDLS